MVQDNLSAPTLHFDRFSSGDIPAASAKLFEHSFGVSPEDIRAILGAGVSKGGEFSEVFLEYRVSNNITMEDDIIKETSESVSLGAGIRVISGEKTGYGYTSELTREKMKEAALTAASIASGMGADSRSIDAFFNEEQRYAGQLYDMKNPFASADISRKLDLVKAAYKTARN